MSRRDLPLLALAVAVSAAGDIIALYALALHLQATTGSGLAVAGVFAANWLALVVLAPWTGALVDRVETRMALIVASVAQAIVAAALAATPGTAGILGLAALLGAGAAVAVPAEFALVPAVAGDRGAAAANGRIETARYAGYFGGPLVAAVLFATSGPGVALLVDSASFVAVAIAACFIRGRRTPAPALERGARGRARDGFVLLGADRQLRLVIAVLVASLLAMSASISADVFFVRETLHTGGFGVGLLMAAWTLGMIAGAVRVAPKLPASVLATAAVAGAAAQGGGKLVAAAIALLPAALLLYGLGGVAHGVKNVAARTLIHERVPGDAHGRAFAAYAALRNGAELGALGIGGLLVDLAGGRVTLLVAGGGTVAAGLAGLLLLSRPRLVAARATPVNSPAR